MQTFLPYPSYAQSAQSLDNKRLGKQRVECLQILKALTLPTYGWKNHPATKMWRGCEWALWEYSRAVCYAWLERGYKDTCQQKMLNLVTDNLRLFNLSERRPPWLGDEAIHASHRSNLLRKDPEWYGQFGWAESHSLPYIWPVS